MPYHRFTHFFSHESSETRDKPKILIRRKSTGALLQPDSCENNSTLLTGPPQARKTSNTVPLGKKQSVPRQRSSTHQDLTLNLESSKKHRGSDWPTPLAPTRENGFRSPQCKNNSRFYEIAWNLVTARRLRSPNSALSSRKHKQSKSENPLSSPLVTISDYRNLLQVSHASGMDRQLSANGDVQSRGNSNISQNGCEVKEDEHSPASVESLVRRSTEYFDASGNCSNPEFLRIFFLSHMWFMTSEQLMILLAQLYEEEKKTENYGKKIFYAIKFWLHEFPHMFDLDPQLVTALEGLRKASSNDPNVDSSLIDLSNIESFNWMSEANLSMRPNQVSRKRRKVSLVFNHLEPEEIASHMSYLEYKSFRRLTLTDLHNYVVHGVIKNNVKLERAVVLFNNITQWVQCMILDHHKPQDRAQAIVKFIEIAKTLYAMRNFNTLMAIVGALTQTAISRLKKTMAAVPKDALKTLDEFVELLDSKSNYSSYRRAYGLVTEEFKIPIIGILMKDLISLHAALPDRIGDGLINVRKMMMIGGMFQELIRLQTTSFPYEINRDLLNTLRVSLYLYYNEDEVFRLSLLREPRDAKFSTSVTIPSPSKRANMGFAEFASFTCQLDEETIKQHVTAMVGSVYKAYDENSDGFITEAEFNHFIMNFPGIDSFAVVDSDKDGRISMEEMIEYFLKISSNRRHQICQGFKHDFVESTYFHPTFCEECKKLLWGLVKQGWKCKDCGINCHKHCKDRIVQECRNRRASRSIAYASPTVKNRNKQRNKQSISSESDFSVNGDTLRLTLNEDEMFRPSGGSNLIRPASFAAADIKSKKLLEQKVFGKSTRNPSDRLSPTRKLSTPNLTYDMGKNTLQRKVQKMLRKKISSKQLFQTTSYPAKRTEDAAKSSLLDLVESNPCNDGNGVCRLHSEAVTELPAADSAANTSHRIAEVATSSDEETLTKTSDSRTNSSNFPTQQVDINLQTLTDRRDSGDEAACKASDNGMNSNNIQLQAITDLQTLTDRRDSGLSSCSCLTTTPMSSSAPVTPSYQDLPCGELRFQYPSTSSSTKFFSSIQNSNGNHSGAFDCTLDNASGDEATKRLVDENDRLEQDNKELRHKLVHANKTILQLQAKLDELNLQNTNRAASVT